MELPRIVQTGDPVLRARAIEVPPDRIPTPEFQALLQIMIATMRAAPGVGLAAPQLGIPWRVIVLEDRAELLEGMSEEERAEKGRESFDTRVFVNPVLKLLGKKKETFFEGCLSVSGFTALVERRFEVEVGGLDAQGNRSKWRVSGWPARILQHEVDHLNGMLYLDRMKTRSFASLVQARAHYAGASIEGVEKLLGIE